MRLEPFATRSLIETPHGEIIQRTLQAAIRAVDPAAAVSRYLRREGNKLTIGEKTWDLTKIKNIWLVGFGKAGAPMARASFDILGDIITAGVVVVKEGYAGEAGSQITNRIEIIEAGHPLPDQRGLLATQKIMRLVQGAGAEDLVICLISGGGSALLTAPAEDLTLDDLQRTTSALLACGASIDEINTLRKHLDEVKGGGLARMAAPAELAALILSDVVGDPLDVIASGPTCADTSTFGDALAIVKHYRLEGQIPAAVIRRLNQGATGSLADTPKSGDALFTRVDNLIVGSNLQAAQAGLMEAQTCGLNTLLLTTFLQGEARQAGRTLAAIARQVAAGGQPLARPACIAAGGETTVILRGNGLGGRNQELALGAVAEMAGLEGVYLVTLATDGGDGPTDAAGAVVNGQTLRRAIELDMVPHDYLERNDSYHFFEALGDLLKTGPTQTNVNDLAFLFAFQAQKNKTS